MDISPPRYQVVKPDPSHIEAVVALFNDAAKHDNDIPATVDDLRRQWNLTGMKDVTLVSDDMGHIIAVVGAVPMPNKQRLFLLFNVHPNHRSDVLIDYLFTQIEDYARRIQPQNKETPITLVHPISGANLWKRDVLPLRDFTVVRGMWRVERVMDEPPESPIFPHGVSIKTFDPNTDLAKLQALAAESFADTAGYEEQQAWLQSVTRDGDYDPTLWYLAVVGDELIGFVLCYPEPERGHIALIGVLPAWRDHDIGTNLILQACNGFYERGVRIVEMHIDSVNPRPLALRVYEKAGLQEVDALLIYEKQLTSVAATL